MSPLTSELSSPLFYTAIVFMVDGDDAWDFLIWCSGCLLMGYPGVISIYYVLATSSAEKELLHLYSHEVSEYALTEVLVNYTGRIAADVGWGVHLYVCLSVCLFV